MGLGYGMKVDYNKAKNNHARSDASRAVQTFLCGDAGTVITVFPQALNSVLKALESLGVWRDVLVIPSSDEHNKPVYILLKVDSGSIIDSVSYSRRDGDN